MKDNYITAVLEKLNVGDNPDEVLTGLKETLTKRGHTRLYSDILRGVERVLSAGGVETATVTVASKAAFTAQKTAIEAALKELESTSDLKITVDETIVGGFVAEANNKRLDHSYKSKLVTLYRSLTK